MLQKMLLDQIKKFANQSCVYQPREFKENRVDTGNAITLNNVRIEFNEGLVKYSNADIASGAYNIYYLNGHSSGDGFDGLFKRKGKITYNGEDFTIRTIKTETFNGETVFTKLTVY